MRYSNVSESFFDFLKNRKKKEIDNVVSRIQNFLDMNPQFGFDSKHMLPGLCPLKKMAESIVVSEKYLKNFIKSINYETMKMFRVNSNIWNGDLVVLMPTTKSKDPKFTKSYSPNIDSLHDYLVGFEDYPKRRRRRSSSKYYYDRYGNRREYKSYVSESFFSDFMSWIKGGDVDSEEINYDNAIFQVTHFLVKYPGYDYDQQNNTPGFIFLTTLANAVQIPYESLLKLFKNNRFENSEIINFKLDTIEGPIVIFGKPPVDRKTQWDSWNAELQGKTEDQIEDIANASVEAEEEVKGEEEQKVSATQPITPEIKDTSKEKLEDIKKTEPTLSSDLVEKISNFTTEAFLEAVIKRAKKDSASVKQRMILNIFETIDEENGRKILNNFIKDILVNKFDYLKSSNLSDKLFQVKDNQKVIKSDLSLETLATKLSNFIWTDETILQELIKLSKDSNDVSSEDLSNIESEIKNQEKDKQGTEKKSEPTQIQNTIQTANFSKLVLEKLKSKVDAKTTPQISEIITSSDNEDDIVTTIKTIIYNFSKFPDDKRAKLLGNVFSEFKNKPGTYYISNDLEKASEIFSDYLISEDPSILPFVYSKIIGSKK